MLSDKNIIDISTWEVKKGGVKDILVSHGIGSCIVVVAINLGKHIGAMAHIMLPGKAPVKEKMCKTKYAEDAVDKLLYLLQIESEDLSQVRICLAGGGNVLKKQNDTICKNNINSILSICKNRQIEIDARSLGGTNHRSVHFDVENKEVYIREGASKSKLLKHWK